MAQDTGRRPVSEGATAPRDEAKVALKKALALAPAETVRLDAQNLLKALTLR